MSKKRKQKVAGKRSRKAKAAAPALQNPARDVANATRSVADRPPDARQILTAKKAAFLAAYEKLGSITHAAEAAGVSRQSHYDWLNNDPEYRPRFRDAEAKAIDSLEVEARRRAMRGTDEPVYYKGKVVGGVRKYSDTLLIFLLKAARPKKYRENVKVEQGGHLKVDSTHRIDMSQFAAIRQELIGHPEILDEHRAEAARQSGAGDAASAAQPVPEKPAEAPQAGPDAKPETE